MSSLCYSLCLGRNCELTALIFFLRTFRDILALAFYLLYWLWFRDILVAAVYLLYWLSFLIAQTENTEDIFLISLFSCRREAALWSISSVIRFFFIEGVDLSISFLLDGSRLYSGVRDIELAVRFHGISAAIVHLSNKISSIKIILV